MLLDDARSSNCPNDGEFIAGFESKIMYDFYVIYEIPP